MAAGAAELECKEQTVASAPPTFSSAKPFSTNLTFKLTVRNCSLIEETFVIRNIELQDFSELSSREGP